MSNWPQYTMLAITFSALVFNLVSDGARQTTSDKVTGAFGSIIVFSVYTGVLWAGGFWTPLWQ